MIIEPFNLDTNIKWILELVIPMILAISGWIFVYLLNVKNMKTEKKIHAKIQAYENMKSSINKVIQSFGYFNTTLFLTSSTLQNLTKDNLLYDLNKSRLLEEQDSISIKTLLYNANSDFVNFIFSWELYEIVFKDNVRERYALEFEFDELLSKFSNVINEYDNYLSYLKLNLEHHNRITNIDLNLKMNEMHEAYTDFNACIRDVSFNLQNYVFTDIFKHKNEKRKVLDEKYLTIETLIKKHQVKIDKENK